jgi:hypothetical protein
MVVLNTAYAAPKNAADPKNRAGDFFYEDHASVGKNRWASRLNTQEKSSYHYEAASGRSNWPNRDPIGEYGGLNLYGTIRNDLVNFIDLLGFAKLDPIGSIADLISPKELNKLDELYEQRKAVEDLRETELIKGNAKADKQSQELLDQIDEDIYKTLASDIPDITTKFPDVQERLGELADIIDTAVTDRTSVLDGEKLLKLAAGISCAKAYQIIRDCYIDNTIASDPCKASKKCDNMKSTVDSICGIGGKL